MVFKRVCCADVVELLHTYTLLLRFNVQRELALTDQLRVGEAVEEAEGRNNHKQIRGVNKGKTTKDKSATRGTKDNKGRQTKTVKQGGKSGLSTVRHMKIQCLISSICFTKMAEPFLCLLTLAYADGVSDGPSNSTAAPSLPNSQIYRFCSVFHLV